MPRLDPNTAVRIAENAIDPYTDAKLTPDTKIKQLLLGLAENFIGLIHQDIKLQVRQAGFNTSIGYSGLRTGHYPTIAHLADEIWATSWPLEKSSGSGPLATSKN